jgi:hypothetical protein
MKRFAASAGMIVIAALSLAAAVWDGSAVAGVGGDFPGDGLFGACNSFPRDTSVTVTNLENGKSIMVTVTNGVENPGVFISLSPKAAAALGMRSGATARIRAVAITASQAEQSLPPRARVGETADPDFNPKVYVERDKAAVKAAAAAAPVEAAAAVTENPEATTQGSGAPEATTSPTTPSQPAATSENPEVAATATANEPQKEPAPALPSLSEENPESPADSLSVPSSPKPVPLGTSLPSPDLPSISEAPIPTPHEENLTLVPEILGGSVPQPRKPAAPRVAMSDPTLPANTSTRAGKVENVSIDAFSPPEASAPASAVALVEPTLAPEALPEAILNRIIAPTKISPVPVLAEAEIPEAVSEKAEFEMIALERPSYADQVEAAALADASAVAPSETYSADQPSKTGAEEVSTELAEAELPGSPDIFGDGKPASPGTAEIPELAPSAELASPEVPIPSESIAAERPAPQAVGEPTVALEPAAPKPPQVAAAIPEGEPNAAPPAAVATVKGSKPAVAAQPPASIPRLKGLAKGYFYIQIGVYGTNDALQSAIGGFKSTYPLAVESLTTKAGSLAFRLFVGPLTRDESGVVLFKIRSLGYKDAYVRKGS